MFVDLGSRAVHADITTGYDTDSFLVVLRRFTAIRGFPSMFYTDEGSQLTSASKELRDIVKSLDLETISQFGHANGVEWKFSTPDAPWQNGVNEIMIKAIKKAITNAIGNQILNFSSLQTVLFEAANLVNERPIGHISNDPDDGSYLCPNQLLLGRASNRVPSGPFGDPKNLKQRFLLLQQIVDAFWRKWTRDYFPSLIVRKKWHTAKRNLCVGDIVMVQDSNTVRGEWRMGKVCAVYPDKNGVVRNVEVKCKPHTDAQSPKVAHITIKRAVQRLVVLLPIEETSQNT